MVSFSCNACQDTLKKPKLVQHFQRCHAPFTCLDCSREMWDGEFQKHTTCISEAEKYEKALYKGDKKKNKGQQGQQSNSNTPVTQQKPAPSAPVTTNGTDLPTPLTSKDIAESVKKVAKTPAASSEVAKVATAGDQAAEGTPRKDRKRKRKSGAAEDAKEGDKQETSTSAAHQAPASNAPISTTTKDADNTTSDASGKRRKRKHNKAAIGDSKGDDTPTDTPANGSAPLESVTEKASEHTKTVESALAAKVPESGSISLSDCLVNVPASELAAVLASVKVQRGKKGKYVICT